MITASRCVFTAAVLAAIAGTSATAVAQVTVAPVALSGTGQNGALGPAIGTQTFSATAFSAAGRTSVINANGDVAFTGASASGTGVWRRSAGGAANVAVARTGVAAPAPATGNYTPNAFNAPFIDNSGNVAFQHIIAATTGPFGTVTDAIFVRASASGSSRLATRGSNTGGLTPVGTGAPLPTAFGPTPPTAGQSNGVQSAMLYNAAGQGALTASWNDGAGNSGSGLFATAASSGNFDTFTPVILRGNTTPAFGDVTAAQVDFVSGPALNDSGKMAFGVDFISGTAPTGNQNRALLTNRNGSLETLFVRRTGASWLGSGEVVGDIGSITPSMNNAGAVTTALPLAGTGITNVNNSAVARFNSDGSVDLLREGAQSGRTTGGGASILLGGANTTTSSLSLASVSSTGRVFFNTAGNADSTGTVLTAATGANALASWSPETGTQVIALSGDTAPGTGGGQFNTFSSSRAVNEFNQVAFLTSLINTAGNPGGVTTSNDLCLYATDPQGNLYLVAREGFALAGDTVSGRTVTSILFNNSINNQVTNGQDGRGTFFNGLGQLVFNVGFSDGNSGVFVANVVPSPAGAGVMAMLGLGLMRRNRRA
jgi:hypothetical protein